VRRAELAIALKLAEAASGVVSPWAQTTCVPLA